MAFTRHGHQIFGSPVEPSTFPTDLEVALKCGGFATCPICVEDAKAWKADHVATPAEIPSYLSHYEAVNHQTRAIDLVCQTIDKVLEKTDPTPDYYVYIVWFTFTLGSWKALLSSTLSDGRYYEVTHNATKKETYIDTYVKIDNISIPDEPPAPVTPTHAIKPSSPAW